MQPQPQALAALPHGPPPMGRGGSFLFGRGVGGVGVGSSTPPFLRVGRVMPANEILRQPRLPPELIACQEFLHRQQTEGPHKPHFDHHWGSKGNRGPPLSLTGKNRRRRFRYIVANYMIIPRDSF